MTHPHRPDWAVRLQSEREKRGWGKWATARRLYSSAGISHPTAAQVKALATQLNGHEAGKHYPRTWDAHYAAVYDSTVEGLFGPPQPTPPLPVGNLDQTGTAADWDDMERRRLLLTALGLGAGSLGSSGESVRQLLDLALASEMRPVEDWQLACVDHLHALRTQPPTQVRDALTVDLLAIQRQLRVASSDEEPELHRVVAALSTLHANILTRLGEHGAAIHWWRTARAAADASGDLNARMMVRCEEAGFGLYGQRDLTTVLRLIDNAESIAGEPPSFWLADLAGTKAKALSLLGRHDEAKQSLRIFVEWDGGDARAGIIPTLWTCDQTYFAQSWVYSNAGDEGQAERARDQVLSHRPDYQYVANVRLHEAVCTVVNGGTAPGAKQAATVLDSLPSAYRSQMITEIGGTVLRAVPYDQRDHPTVREFREVLAKTAPRPALTSGL